MHIIPQLFKSIKYQGSFSIDSLIQLIFFATIKIFPHRLLKLQHHTPIAKMKKYFLTALSLIISLSLISWGIKGHQAVGQIAENHLTPKTRESIQKLLGHESLAEVSTWADEIRTIPQYKGTGIYHYVNLPSGLSFEQFANTIKTMPEDNVYKIVLRCEQELKDPSRSKNQKVIALKFLVHLVGDLHQPMHVSHAEDKGGGTISVSLMGYNYNLHGLWDEGLIDHEGLSSKQMAINYDTARPEEIKKWQSDDLMIWLWESYQVATILYQEAAENPLFDEEYYKTHITVLQKRIEKGGIRLAGVLNGIFDGE